MSVNSLSAAVDIFAAPQNVFDPIREKALSAWFPFILIIGLSTAVMAWYFLTVDMYQFMETSLLVSGREVVEAEMEMILQQESVIRIVSVVQTAIMGAIMLLLLALFYFLAASLIAEEKFSYGQFFAVVAWGSLPQLLSVLSMALSYLLASDFVYIALLDKTSVASILGLGLDSENLTLLSSLSVGSVWSLVLYAYGFARLTRCSVATAVIVGVIPAALQYGLLSLF